MKKKTKKTIFIILLISILFHSFDSLSQERIVDLTTEQFIKLDSTANCFELFQIMSYPDEKLLSMSESSIDSIPTYKIAYRKLYKAYLHYDNNVRVIFIYRKKEIDEQ